MTLYFPLIKPWAQTLGWFVPQRKPYYWSDNSLKMALKAPAAYTVKRSNNTTWSSDEVKKMLMRTPANHRGHTPNSLSKWMSYKIIHPPFITIASCYKGANAVYFLTGESMGTEPASNDTWRNCSFLSLLPWLNFSSPEGTHHSFYSKSSK